jgi:hypothetical protein
MTNFWSVWTQPENEICQQYAAYGFGGAMVSMPCGITNAIMTNIGAVLLMKLSNLIKFRNNHYKVQVTVFSIFVMSYMNMGILPMVRFDQFHWMPPDFTV